MTTKVTPIIMSLKNEIRVGDEWADRFGDTMVVVGMDAVSVLARYPDKNWALTFSRRMFTLEYSRLVKRNP